MRSVVPATGVPAEMTLVSEWGIKCARRTLDTFCIVRDAMLGEARI